MFWLDLDLKWFKVLDLFLNSGVEDNFFFHFVSYV